MSKRSIFSLLLVSLALVLVFILTQGGSQNKKNGLVLNNLDKSSLSKIILEKDDSRIELGESASKDWVVLNRFNYPASSTSLNGLIFKLMDLSGSQSIDLTDSGLNRLGLSEESKKSGQGIITLFNKEGKEIDKLFLGGVRNRKNTTVEETISLSGQYIRKNSNGNSFLLALPISIQTDFSSWLETEILSVPSAKLFSITSYATEPFSLTRSSPIQSADIKAEFSLNENIPSGKELDKLVLSQVISGLEDLKLENVYLSSPLDDEIKDLKFIELITYRLLNGLVYKVLGAEKGEKSFISLSVEYSDSLANEAIALEAKELEGKESDATQDNNKQQKDNKPKIIKSSVEEAEKLQQEYSKWKYQIPKFVFSRFNKAKSNLLKDIAAPNS